jgi:hypothetical protein
MQRMSRDIRFDDVLANACQADRKDFCPDVQPVSSKLERNHATLCTGVVAMLLTSCLIRMKGAHRSLQQL